MTGRSEREGRKKEGKGERGRRRGELRATREGGDGSLEKVVDIRRVHGV